MDHTCLADREPVDRPDHKGIELGIDRGFNSIKQTTLHSLFSTLYWLIFISFFSMMLVFVAPTFDKSTTLLSLALCILLILTPTDHRYALLTFIAGASLGYYLELWGTTRECWTYYTFETPPFFAVLAHGMAAVAFWRAGLMLKMVANRIRTRIPGQVEVQGQG